MFDPVALVGYVSTIVTLNPGDLILTGTPGGVGHARTPQRYLQDGSQLRTEIDGLGSQRNAVRGLAADLSRADVLPKSQTAPRGSVTLNRTTPTRTG